MIEPLPSDVSCEYYLDSVTPDGALNGGSTCAGMPQQTRLEVPSVARAWMTHAELVTVLVAVLSSPPLVLAEDYGPRFEQPSTGSFPTSAATGQIAGDADDHRPRATSDVVVRLTGSVVVLETEVGDQVLAAQVAQACSSASSAG